MQAYLEWMPFRLPDQSVPHQGTRFFKRFTFGALGDLSVLETRQNRSQQVDVPGLPLPTAFIPVGVNPAVDAAIADRPGTCPSPRSSAWLKDAVARRGRPMAPGRQPGDADAGALPGGGARGTGNLTLLNSDQWDGYQADQDDLLGALRVQPPDGGDVVVLTGDIHSSWAVRAAGDRTAVGEVRLGGRRVRLPVGDQRRLLRGSAPRCRGGPRPAARGRDRRARGAVSANPWVRTSTAWGTGTR